MFAANTRNFSRVLESRKAPQTPLLSSAMEGAVSVVKADGGKVGVGLEMTATTGQTLEAARPMTQ